MIQSNPKPNPANPQTRMPAFGERETPESLPISFAFTVMLWQVVQIYLSGMRHVTQGLLLVVGICLPLILEPICIPARLQTAKSGEKPCGFRFSRCLRSIVRRCSAR